MADQQSSAPKHYDALDALRGLAALTVLGLHMVILSRHGYGVWYEGEPSQGILENLFFRAPLGIIFQGYNAVILFFVLSGFVLSLPWIRQRPQPFHVFIVRRITRIYPPYLVAILGSFILLALVGHHQRADASLWYNVQIWSGPFDIPTMARILYMDTRNAFMDYPTWTISWEVSVGIVFPLVMAPFKRWRAWGLLVSAGVVLVVAILVMKAGGLPAQVAKSGAVILWLFMLGAALACWADRYASRAMEHWLLTTTLGLAGAFLLSFDWISRPVSGLLCAPLGSMLVICAAVSSPAFIRLLSTGWARWLGKISFSLYLVHVPILSACLSLNLLPLKTTLVIGAVLSLLMAVPFNRWVEMPCQKLGRKLTRRGKPQPPKGPKGVQGVPG